MVRFGLGVFSPQLTEWGFCCVVRLEDSAHKKRGRVVARSLVLYLVDSNWMQEFSFFS